MGVADHLIASELEQMDSVVFSKTASRRVLGSLNDFVHLLEAYNDSGLSLSEITQRVADTPCGPLGMESPDRATPLLFKGQPVLRVVK